MLSGRLTRRQTMAGLAALACARPWSGAAAAASGSILSGRTMGTAYAVTVPRLPDGLTEARCRETIDTALDGVDRRMSTWRADSEVSRFNARRQTGWFDVSPDTVTVIEEALTVGRMTGGAFDITAGPLIALWGFGAAPPRTAPPADTDIARARQQTGFRHLSVRHSPPAIAKAVPRLALDLSGIAKGYAVDRVAKALEGLGIADYLVEVGGEIRASGRNRHGRAWTLGIERPEPGPRRIVRRMAVTAGGVATSGDYRDRFSADGRVYSHIIDPRTGRPETHDLASATVVAATAMRADALATGLMVLGFDDGKRLAAREGLAVFLIRRTADGFEEWASPSIRRYLTE